MFLTGPDIPTSPLINQCISCLYVIVGGCGSCYAFSAMGMNEARLRVRSNNTVAITLSTQDIVECSQYSQGWFFLQSHLQLELSHLQLEYNWNHSLFINDFS